MVRCTNRSEIKDSPRRSAFLKIHTTVVESNIFVVWFYGLMVLIVIFVIWFRSLGDEYWEDLISLKSAQCRMVSKRENYLEALPLSDSFQPEKGHVHDTVAPRKPNGKLSINLNR